MEIRSHRRIRDLVAHTAFQGLDANEIGCVRISMMAGSNTLRSKGRIQMSETSHLQISHIRLATHGRSIHAISGCEQVQQTERLFDYLVGASEQGEWNGETERSRRF